MKTLTSTTLMLSALLIGAGSGYAQTTLSVDSTRSWQGYMNVFGLNADGTPNYGAYQFGSGWGAVDLRAYFNGTASLTLTPCVNVWNPTDPYWVANGKGNKWMDANYYVQDDTLAGQNLTFSGTCLSNSLVSPANCVAFIKDFAPDYSWNYAATAALQPGQPFSMSLQTTPGHHIQYGFEIQGPDVDPAKLAEAGSVWVAVNNADPSLPTMSSLALVEGQNATFTITPRGTAPFAYAWTRINATGSNVLSSGGRISGASSNSLTISNLALSDTGTYSVMVTNSRGSGLATAVLTVIPLTQARSNLLVEPGFESGAFVPSADAGWVNFGGAPIQSTNDFYYLSATPVAVVDGAYCLETYSTGPGSYNGAYQERPAFPGEIYGASMWFRTPSEDPIGGAGACGLEVQFRNAAGEIIVDYMSPKLDTNSPVNTWLRLEATNQYAADFVTFLGSAPYLVAPPGTAKVRFQVTYHADTGGAVYADAGQLRLLATPATASLGGGTPQLTFPTHYGSLYNVLYKNNLTDPSWQVLTPVTGDGTLKSLNDSSTAGSRFYIINAQ